MSWLTGFGYCALLGVLSCSPRGRAPAPSLRHVRLSAGLAAKVASDGIALDTVARIAQAQSVSPALARDRAVSDALYAAGARAAFEGGSVVPVIERAAQARALLETLKADAAARGPATDAEVAELTALRWQDLDRPETVRTTHALAQVQRPDLDAQAKAIAQHIWEAVRGVTDPEEFMRLAQAVPHEGVDVRAERLPALTRDGRVYYPETTSADARQRFDEDFARAAHALSVGEISGPVKTAFGYHVILCEARLPGRQVPLAERRALLAGDVLKSRAERAKQELLVHLSGSTPAMIARSADDLTSLVRVAE